MVYPVCVPSKGRVKSKLISAILREGIPLLVFVEPQDYQAYKAKYGELVVDVGKNDMGVWYVRDYIHKYMSTRWAGPWYWSIDDNVTRMHRRNKEGAYERISFREGLSLCESLVKSIPEVGVFGPENKVLAWSHKEDFNLHGKPYGCFCTHVDSPVQYKKEYSLKEDIATTLELMVAGLKTVHIYSVSFSKPSQGSTPGGNSTEYKSTKDGMPAVRALQEKYGAELITTFTDNKGGTRIRVQYTKIRNKFLQKVESNGHLGGK